MISDKSLEVLGMTSHASSVVHMFSASVNLALLFMFL